MPRNRAARPLTECLEADAAMMRLATQAKRLLQLQRCFESASPPALSRHCRVANYKLGTVVIHADNGAVAAKIRQLTASLANEFCQCGLEVTEIRVKVQPRGSDHLNLSSPTSNSLTCNTKRALATLRDNLPKDSALEAALKRLIENSRES